MKKLFSVLVTLAVIFSSITAFAAVPGEHHGVDIADGFEYESLTWQADNLDKASASLSDKAHSGSKALKVTATGANSKVYFTDFLITNHNFLFDANKTYYLEYWVMQENANNVSRKIFTQATGFSQRYVNVPANTWTKVSLTMTGVSGALAVMHYESAVETDIVYVDDFVLREVVPTGATVNQLSYVSIEDTTSLAGLYNGSWAKTNLEISQEQAHFGTSSLKLSGLSADWNGFCIKTSELPGGFSLTAGKTYYISAYMYFPDSVPNAWSNDYSIASGTYSYLPTAKWVKISGVVTPAANAADKVLTKFFIPKQETSGCIYIDDILLAEVSVPAVSLTASIDAATGTVSIDSNLELQKLTSVNVTSATLANAALSANGKTISADISGLAADTEYTFTVTALDAFGRNVTATAVALTGESVERTKWVMNFSNNSNFSEFEGGNVGHATASYDADAKALKVVSDGTGYAEIYLNRYFTAKGFVPQVGQEYSISMKLKTSADRNMLIRFYGSTNDTRVTADEDWKTINFQFAGGATTTARISNYSGENMNASGDIFWVDDIVIETVIPDYEVTASNLTGGSATATVKNNTEEDKEIALIVATYNNGVLVGTNMDKQTVPTGKSKDLAASVTVNDGETVEMFVWTWTDLVPLTK